MAINPKIKQKAEDIRKKIFGAEVRESLASGLEGMSEDVESIKGRQGNVENQFQDVLNETIGKDLISAPELIAARNGKSNLKTRLDDEHAQVTAQLQQKIYYFNTVNEMKNKNQLKVGSFVTTSGYHAGGDGGGANYLILDEITEDVDYYETLNNGLYASLTSIKEHGYVDVRWLGAKSNLDKSVTPHTGTDAAPYFEQALAITNKNLGMRIKVIGNYYWGTELHVLTDLNLFGEHNTNRLLTGSANNPELIVKSPSEIYINPSLTQAITLEGMGGTLATSWRSTHFTLEKLYVHSDSLDTNFLRITAYGAPSRPSWVQDLQAHTLKYVLLFDYVEPRGASGTHTYNFSARGGCDIYSVASFIKAKARSGNNPGLGGLSVFDNSLEWMTEGAIQAEHLFGYNRIENNLMEGSPSNMQLTLGYSTTDIKGNYFEGNGGTLNIEGIDYFMSRLRMEDNYFLSNTTEYYIRNVQLHGLDEKIEKENVCLVNVAADNPKWFEGLIPSKQKPKNNQIYNNHRTTSLPLVDETTLLPNQFIIPMGSDFITPNIKGKLLTGGTYASLPEGSPAVEVGDITVVCYYATKGLYFNGYYDEAYTNNGYGTVFKTENNHPFKIDIFFHKTRMDRFRLLFRKEDENVRVSDVLVSVLKGAEQQEDLYKWLGVPHQNAINP